jgi:hypothetical protein
MRSGGKVEGDLRDQMIKPLLLKHKMHMTRPPRVPSQLVQHFSHRAVTRNTIRHRHNRLEPEHTILVAPHDTPAIRLITAVALVLHIVRTFAVRFPDVDLDVLYGFTVLRLHGAEAEQGCAIRVSGDGRTFRVFLRVVRVVRAEHGAFGGGGRFRVVY